MTESKYKPVYFSLKFSDSLEATRLLWKQAESIDIKAPLNISSVGDDANISAESKVVENAFRNILKELKVEFTEHKEKTVSSWLDGFFS